MTDYGIINQPACETDDDSESTREEMISALWEYIKERSGRAPAEVLIIGGEGIRRLRVSDFSEAIICNPEPVRTQHGNGPRNRWGNLK